jgi:hypothetical protein
MGGPQYVLITDIIRQIKSRRIRWAGHVARMVERRKCTRFWWESPKATDPLEDGGVDGRMGLEWTLEDWLGGGG